MRKIRLIVALVVTALIVIVILQNLQSVETRILFITIAMPRALLLLVVLLVGFALGVVSAERITGREKKKTHENDIGGNKS